MSHAPPRAAAFTVVAVLIMAMSSSSGAYNITKILAGHPEFSTFNHYLTVTRLAGEINRRDTITVLALDNAAMSSILSKQLSLYTLKNVLSLHVLVDYFGAKKLHQITDGSTLTATMFQATGAAPGTTGYINVTDLKGGKVAFGAENNDGTLNSRFVKSVKEIPYSISIIQISQALTSSEAEAPTASPSDFNITEILSKQGCKAFADLLKATATDTTFQTNIDGGLTVFCPTDSVLKSFAPKYKNLTAAQKASLLLYHGVPVYQSLQMLKSSNGVINTLATDGADKYDFTVQNSGEAVTLETRVVTAKLKGTVIDEEPLVVYKIDKVLQPKELFKVAKVVSAKASGEADADAPADGPAGDDDAAAADENAAAGVGGGAVVGVFLSLCLGLVIMF